MNRRTTSSPLRGCALLLTVALLTGCVPEAPSSAAPPSSPQTTASPSYTVDATVAADANVVAMSATAIADHVAVCVEPGGSVTQSLPNPQRSGAPLTFLVAARRGDWIQVLLAQRPNVSTGWVTADSVTLSSLVYSLEVSTGRNTPTLCERGA